MKARLLPIYFKEEKTDKFSNQLSNLKDLLGKYADFLVPIGLGDPLTDCDAVVFPEILGEAYRNIKAFQDIDKPILLITSEFATVSMWDWEFSNFLECNGVVTISPYNIEQSILICKMIGTKRKMAESKFLIFQDNPGEGFQPDIFKSFYWWEDQCTQKINNKFGITIERRSLKTLGEKAANISDADAKAVWSKWNYPVTKDFSERMAFNGAKLYLALKNEIDSENIIGMGTNCLNESHYCKSTPCLAWDRFLEERNIIWACEGDTVTLTTKVMLYGSFGKPLMMTNIYPFLMDQAALKHEKIPNFPELIRNPENHILLAHCGYFGLVPRIFSSKWTLAAPVLAIVNENSHVFNARMKEGPVMVSKLNASMDKLMSVKANLKGYIQYDITSDCRNGGVIEVTNGKTFMDRVYSHHIILIEDDLSNELRILGKIMDLEVDEF